MANDQQALNQLLEKMQLLLDRQETFAKEINEIRGQIDQLVVGQFDAVSEEEAVPIPEKLVVEETVIAPITIAPAQEAPAPLKEKKPLKTRSEMEKFIGENLINKIGIAVTIIGVGIGAKYAIDNEMISPLMRILLGVLVGLILIGLGYQLKKNYASFSAVLLSGGIAIIYFMTFLGFELYGLLSKEAAFGIMVLLTCYTVWESISYDQQVIALIGLVGAYAVPFLLSDGSGNATILFSYILIINIGILFLSFMRQWKNLYYAAFGLTWLIFFTWIVNVYDVDEPLAMALTFASMFFVVFYLTFLAFKLGHAEQFKIADVFILLLNTFTYYSICYVLLDQHDTGKYFLGFFTLCNAIVHVIVAALVQRKSMEDKNIFYLISGMALVFITMSIPVQFDGNWVTLLWAGQSALLFWIGRERGVVLYEKLAYGLIALTVFSIMQDWSLVQKSLYYLEDAESLRPFQSVSFFSSLVVMSVLGYIFFLHQKSIERSAFSHLPDLQRVINYSLAIALIIGLYYPFYLEIDMYWTKQIVSSRNVQSDSGMDSNYLNSNLQWLKNTWLNMYTLFFMTILLALNVFKFKSRPFGTTLFVINSLVMLLFLIGGLYALSELREYYLEQNELGIGADIFNIGIRYLALSIVLVNIVLMYKMVESDYMLETGYRKAFDIILFSSLLWIASSELIHWMSMAHSAQSYKLAMSILWGVYSLSFVSIGIWKKKQYYRVAAMSLFGVTLLKLFFYDISHLNTISKTIVFVSLGVLLLIISFLYNKYKHVIGDKEEHHSMDETA